jgi:hypothetical protein
MNAKMDTRLRGYDEIIDFVKVPAFSLSLYAAVCGKK